MGVGLMGWMSMCVCVVFLSILCNAVGIWVLFSMVPWLCTHMIDVRDGSVYW